MLLLRMSPLAKGSWGWDPKSIREREGDRGEATHVGISYARKGTRRVTDTTHNEGVTVIYQMA